jgi:hypothetical protein
MKILRTMLTKTEARQLALKNIIYRRRIYYVSLYKHKVTQKNTVYDGNGQLYAKYGISPLEKAVSLLLLSTKSQIHSTCLPFVNILVKIRHNPQKLFSIYNDTGLAQQTVQIVVRKQPLTQSNFIR